MAVTTRIGSWIFLLLFLLPACGDSDGDSGEQLDGDDAVGPSIQERIDAAPRGATILVPPGTYMETIDFRGKSLTLRSEAGPEATVIDGNGAQSVVTVVGLEIGPCMEVIIDGFKIRNGEGGFPWNRDNIGGGIFGSLALIEIRSCVIEENRASVGGGIAFEACSVTITSCTIERNRATAIPEGGAGGIFCGGSPSTITNCTISENFTNGLGGGIVCADSPSTITNCLITDNWALSVGGGLLCMLDSPLEIVNCTISGNHAFQDSGGGILCSDDEGYYPYPYEAYLTVVNSIVWGNHAPCSPQIEDRCYTNVLGSNVQGGWEGIGNLDAFPLFVGGGDYHLTPFSPCIDAGAGSGPATDIDGQPRPFGAGVDMGADEFWPGFFD